MQNKLNSSCPHPTLNCCVPTSVSTTRSSSDSRLHLSQIAENIVSKDEVNVKANLAK